MSLAIILPFNIILAVLCWSM